MKKQPATNARHKLHIYMIYEQPVFIQCGAKQIDLTPSLNCTLCQGLSIYKLHISKANLHTHSHIHHKSM